METIRYLFRVERREINYIQSIIESYDGMARVSTIDPWEAIIEVRISQGCEDQFFELLDDLMKREGLEMRGEALSR